MHIAETQDCNGRVSCDKNELLTWVAQHGQLAGMTHMDYSL